MKILISLFAVGAIIFTLFIIIVDKDQRWLIINGSEAEMFAISLLEKDTGVQTPDRFIGYSVSSNDGYVVFSKHSEHEAVYGYFPKIVPPEIGDEAVKLKWKSLGDNWFVAHP